MIDTLKTVPAYKTYIDIFNFILNGYYKTGPVEFGPIVSLISYDKLEGFRFGAGMRTNARLCNWAQGGGNIAYGLRDKKVKGSIGVQFMADKHPRQIIRASFMHDIGKISRTTDLLASDNILNVIILRRRPLERWLYLDIAKLGYEIEYKPGMSMSMTLQNRRIGQGLVPFRYLYSNGESVNDTLLTLNETELVWKARFAIGEKYIDRNSLFRSSINAREVPVVQLEYVYGMKGFLGSQYNYHKITLAFSDMIRINTIGRFEMKIQAGKLFGNVPFLLSEVHDGNQTFAFSNTAFNVMNDYEFYSDQYVQWNFAHHFDGFFLNRIPGIRKLKLREVIQTRGVWGNVSAQNLKTNQLNDGFIHPLGKVPYVEVGFGLENILKFIRWDTMWRVTHRDAPRAYNWIMTFGFNFNF
jgi:hypothetical protein